MRILYLVVGNDFVAGGATIRDAVFVKGLTEAGHEVEAVSLYGHVGVEGESGYSSVFKPLSSHTLRRYFPHLAKLPEALASFANGVRPLDNMTSAVAMGGRIDPKGPLAVGLLAGTNKLQRREFSRLATRLSGNANRVDAAVFSNVMLSGLAEPIRERFDCPIICLSQGADRFIEALEEPYRSETRRLARRNARLFRLVVASSRHFAIRAAEFLSLPAARIKVAPPGVDAEAMTHSEPRRREPFTVGYMAPIRKDKGLDILVEAMETLTAGGVQEAELWIAGRVEEERYWNRLCHRLEMARPRLSYRTFGSLGLRERRNFMMGLSAFAVSSREPESRATHMLEAMAAGVPVVGPAAGVIPEVFQQAAGGLLVSSDAPAWMFAQALEILATMPDTADEMGQAGRAGVREHFSMDRAAGRLCRIIEEALGKGTPGK